MKPQYSSGHEGQVLPAPLPQPPPLPADPCPLSHHCMPSTSSTVVLMSLSKLQGWTFLCSLPPTDSSNSVAAVSHDDPLVMMLILPLPNSPQCPPHPRLCPQGRPPMAPTLPASCFPKDFGFPLHEPGWLCRPLQWMIDLVCVATCLHRAASVAISKKNCCLADEPPRSILSYKGYLSEMQIPKYTGTIM